MPCASFSLLDGPDQFHRDRQSFKMMHMASRKLCKNSSKLNKFLQSEVNLLIQHIIVQDKDGQNNNIPVIIVRDEFFLLIVIM